MPPKASKNVKNTGRVLGKLLRDEARAVGQIQKGSTRKTVKGPSAIPQGSNSVNLNSSRPTSQRITAAENSSMASTGGHFISSTRRISHAASGMEGVSLHFRQPFADIGANGTDLGLFINNGTLASRNDVFTISLNPDNLNGPIAAKANYYNRYRFKWIKIHYISASSTAVASTLSLSILDGWNSLSPSTFSLNRLVEGCAVFPPWQAEVTVSHVFRSDELFFCKADSSNNAASRQTFQALISGIAVALANYTYGYTDIEGELELYDEMYSQSITSLSSFYRLERLNPKLFASMDKDLKRFFDECCLKDSRCGQSPDLFENSHEHKSMVISTQSDSSSSSSSSSSTSASQPSGLDDGPSSSAGDYDELLVLRRMFTDSLRRTKLEESPTSTTTS